MQPFQGRGCLITQIARNMEEVLPELKAFIAGYCHRYKLRRIDQDELTLDTSIDLDLGIFDIEIDLFLAEFVDSFRVDNSKFTWYKYGYPEGSMSVGTLQRVFGYDKSWVRKLAARLYQPKFRVYNLQQAIKSGRLV